MLPLKLIMRTCIFPLIYATSVNMRLEWCLLQRICAITWRPIWKWLWINRSWYTERRAIYWPNVFPIRSWKLIFLKQVARINFFGVSGIVRFIFDMVATSECTPHKSDYVEINMKINPKKLKGISEVLKIEGI